MLNINDVIVGKEAAKHCVYLNGKYVGLIYVDANGNVYGSPAEVKEALGDDIIYFSDNSLRHIEVDYCAEEDCLVAISYRIYFRWYNQYDSNPTPITNYNGLLDIQEPEYYYIDKDMNVISSVNHYCNTIDSLSSYDCAKPFGMMKAIKKLWRLNTGVVNVGGNTYIPLDCVDNIKQYQNYKAKLMHKPGKIQNKIDELTEQAAPAEGEEGSSGGGEDFDLGSADFDLGGEDMGDAEPVDMGELDAAEAEPVDLGTEEEAPAEEGFNDNNGQLLTEGPSLPSWGDLGVSYTDVKLHK